MGWITEKFKFSLIVLVPIYIVMAPTISAAEYGYKGCYQDNAGARDLPTRATSGDGSIEACATVALQNGFPYFGLQYGVECWMGNKYGTYGTSSACNKPCTGNAQTTCGGNFANSVYQFPGYEFKGCYKDDPGARDLSIRATSGDGTIAACKAIARQNFYPYFGLQYGRECWMGTQYGTYGTSSACNMPCAGNSQITCGGSFANSVYYYSECPTWFNTTLGPNYSPLPLASYFSAGQYNGSDVLVAKVTVKDGKYAKDWIGLLYYQRGVAVYIYRDTVRTVNTGFVSVLKTSTPSCPLTWVANNLYASGSIMVEGLNVVVRQAAVGYAFDNDRTQAQIPSLETSVITTRNDFDYLVTGCPVWNLHYPNQYSRGSVDSSIDVGALLSAGSDVCDNIPLTFATDSTTFQTLCVYPGGFHSTSNSWGSAPFFAALAGRPDCPARWVSGDNYVRGAAGLGARYAARGSYGNNRLVATVSTVPKSPVYGMISTGQQVQLSGVDYLIAEPGILFSGDTLGKNNVLVSPNKEVYLTVRDDNNLALYCGYPDYPGRALFLTRTGQTESAQLDVTTDGNVILHPAGWGPDWQTGTSGLNQRVYLAVQDDRNVVLYARNGSAVWETSTDEYSCYCSIWSNVTVGTLPSDTWLRAGTDNGLDVMVGKYSVGGKDQIINVVANGSGATAYTYNGTNVVQLATGTAISVLVSLPGCLLDWVPSYSLKENLVTVSGQYIVRGPVVDLSKTVDPYYVGSASTSDASVAYVPKDGISREVSSLEYLVIKYLPVMQPTTAPKSKGCPVWILTTVRSPITRLPLANFFTAGVDGNDNILVARVKVNGVDFIAKMNFEGGKVWYTDGVSEIEVSTGGVAAIRMSDSDCPMTWVPNTLYRSGGATLNGKFIVRAYADSAMSRISVGYTTDSNGAWAVIPYAGAAKRVTTFDYLVTGCPVWLKGTVGVRPNANASAFLSAGTNGNSEVLVGVFYDTNDFGDHIASVFYNTGVAWHIYIPYSGGADSLAAIAGGGNPVRYVMTATADCPLKWVSRSAVAGFKTNTIPYKVQPYWYDIIRAQVGNAFYVGTKDFFDASIAYVPNGSDVLTVSSFDYLVTEYGKLFSGENLTAGQTLLSPYKKAYITIRDDGRLGLYCGTPKNTGSLLYLTASSSQLSGTLRVQSDGKAVIYNTGGTPIWSTGTAPYNEAVYLSVQDDYNLVLYKLREKQQIWESNTDGLSCWSSVLNSGDSLRVGQKLMSPNRKVYITVQDGGCLALYCGTPDNQGALLYLTSPSSEFSGTLRVQMDGNVVIYNNKSIPVWNTGTASSTEPFLPVFLAVQDDQNLVLYRVSNRQPMWATGTQTLTCPSGFSTLGSGQKLSQGQTLSSPNKEVFLKVTNDRNVRLYCGTPDNLGRTLWWTNMAIKPQDGNVALVVQDDGNAVLYNGKTAPWSTGTSSYNQAVYLAVQNDHNVALYTVRDQQKIWETKTTGLGCTSVGIGLGRQNRTKRPTHTATSNGVPSAAATAPSSTRTPTQGARTLLVSRMPSMGTLTPMKTVSTSKAIPTPGIPSAAATALSSTRTATQGARTLSVSHMPSKGMPTPMKTGSTSKALPTPGTLPTLTALRTASKAMLKPSSSGALSKVPTKV